MKVLVADKFEKSGLEGLEALGVDLVYSPELQGTSLRDALAATNAEVAVVRSTTITAEMIDASNLSLIIRAGAGFNTIDVQAASERGVLVTNCPGKNSQAVAELAFGLILACDRHIPDNVAALRQGKWQKKKFSAARGLYGRTLGLIGMGKISQEMIPRAKAFGMTVIAYSRWMTPELAAALNIARASTIQDIARMSDVVSVHVSLTPETRNLLNKHFFDAMKEGATVVNTSRAEVVDQQALIDAVNTRGILAGLDVFDGEPSGGEGVYEGPLTCLNNVYCTHHIGASTEQAQEAVAAEVVKIVRDYRETGTAPNVVNVGRAELATHLLVVRHLDKVGVLARVLSVLKKEGISVQEMENVILGGAKAAIAQISVDACPSPEAIAAIKRNENVFDVNVIRMKKGE